MASSSAARRLVHGFPAEMTGFVGRRQECADVERMVAAWRVVTLTGVGGVGKSRLASRVAVQTSRSFRDGVWLVELADLHRPEFLLQTVAEALQIRDQSDRPMWSVVLDHLRERQMLIVLDNCEHLLADCAGFAATLVQDAPGVRILATSRQPLGIAGERIYRVPPLSLAGQGHGADAATSPAVQLFTDRARMICLDFTLTDDNRNAVERICRRLDGIALAIELAAARLRVLSVDQLLDRLEHCFELLTAGPRMAPARHQTLRALFDWSHALCTDDERRVWARLSVFGGGLGLDAAEAVCAGDGVAREEIVDIVSGLVDKSILIAEHGPAVTRYRLLETVRQYGREHLAASGEETAVRRRHRDHYRELCAAARAQILGPNQMTMAVALRVDHPNLRAAMEYCLTEPGQARVALDMAAELLFHWITGYYLREGRYWLDRALDADRKDSEARARALWTAGWLSIMQADVESATPMLTESLEIAGRLGLGSIAGYVELFQGMIAMFREDTDSAIRLYEESIRHHRETGDDLGLVMTLIRLSLAYSFRGDAERAVAAGREVLAVSGAHDDRWARAYGTIALGVEAWRQGDTDGARAYEQESLRFLRHLDNPLGVGVSLEVLAWIAAEEEDHTRAARLIGILRSLWRMTGAPLSGFGHLSRYKEECECKVRGALGDRAFDAAVAEGAALPYEDALAYALRESRLEAPAGGGTRRPSPLTGRQTEVARLVGEGLSNREIAARLVIAQRTAEGHVEHILAKLGFTSRAQIAAWITEGDA